MFNRQRVMLVGVILLMISVLPIVQGMTSASTHRTEGANTFEVEQQLADAVSLALSPPFLVMSNVGLLLVIVSLFLRKRV